MKMKVVSSAMIVGLALALTTGCVVYRDRPVAVVVGEPPPAPVAEVVTACPGPEYAWVGGAWAWHGRWIWAPGSWMIRPHARAVWVGGHWGRGRRGWVWHPGRWR